MIVQLVWFCLFGFVCVFLFLLFGLLAFVFLCFQLPYSTLVLMEEILERPIQLPLNIVYLNKTPFQLNLLKRDPNGTIEGFVGGSEVPAKFAHSTLPFQRMGNMIRLRRSEKTQKKYESSFNTEQGVRIRKYKPWTEIDIDVSEIPSGSDIDLVYLIVSLPTAEFLKKTRKTLKKLPCARKLIRYPKVKTIIATPDDDTDTWSSWIEDVWEVCLSRCRIHSASGMIDSQISQIIIILLMFYLHIIITNKSHHSFCFGLTYSLTRSRSITRTL